jgi:hypothetical protein
MAPQPEIEALCNQQALAARAVYRERLATSVKSFEAAAAAFKDAVVALAGEPSPQNAGRYLAASERLTAIRRELETSGSSRETAPAVALADAGTA